MVRAITILCVLAVAAPLALGDRLTLVDGRSFSGIVTVKDDTVEIELTYGTLQFSADEVLDIEYKETLESQFRRMMRRTPEDDPNALCALGEWASENGLTHQARELFQSVLKLDPNHSSAHRGLGHVQIDKKWRKFDEAVELGRSKLEAGKYEDLLDNILPEMETAAGGGKRLVAVWTLKAHAQLRSRQFAEAYETFQQLTDKAKGPAKLRCAAIAEILSDNGDGMYVLSEPHPPAVGLLGHAGRSYPPGPASLADPIVLQAALRDSAKEEVEIGRVLMDEAAQLEPADPDVAKARYAQAVKAFDHADALVPDISRSYRVEIVRRKVAAARKDIEGDSGSFDREMEDLGRAGMSPQEYRDRIVRMIHSLDNVRRGLQEVLELAAPYPRELVLEVKWAELDLKRIEEMRKTLTAELNEEN